MSYNKYHGHHLKDRILEAVRLYPEGATPKFISNTLKLNHSTVRAYMRDMFRRGILKQNYKYGFYSVIKTIHGITNYNIHNIYLTYTFTDINLTTSHKKIRFDNIKLKLYFGKKSKKATCSVSSDKPLSLREFLMAKYVFESEVKKELNIDYLPELYVKSVEINEDFRGVRMEGINAVTWTNFIGMLEKVYNKKEKVRKEYKVSVPMKADVLVSVLRNNVDVYPLIMRVDNIEKDVKGIKEIMRRK
ncbi:MAG: hypothetical protein PHW96_04670 [Candidatus Nanoarchaeia archaeon]|nr:hypothetical protein [Candidatus Nanoarchaeia archaeon]